MVKLYVGGGGDTAALRTACREGFTAFITRSGITKRPRVVACGSRRDAYDSFCIAIANGEAAVLLVDSEAPVAVQQESDKPETWQPWQHLKQRSGDGWDQPTGSADIDCHLMVQCMESWFLTDHDTLKVFFGQGFRESALPATGQPKPIESVAKLDVYKALAKATDKCKTKTPYGKGEHSFRLLARINPSIVTAASPWAKRFVDTLKRKMAI